MEHHTIVTVVQEEQPLDDDPLVELVKRSHARGACDAEGIATGFPVPWAFQLATHSRFAAQGAPPAMRSLGFHSVNSEGFLFVCRGGPGGCGGPLAKDVAAKDAGGGGDVASILHLAGNYPGANFEEQWRAEGVVRPVPLSDLSKVAPLDADLEVQVVASDAFEKSRVDTKGSVAPVDPDGRLFLQGAADAATLHDKVTAAAKSRLTPERAAAAGLRAYRFVPLRMEVIEGGPSWPAGPRRNEWHRGKDSAAWVKPRRLLPYNRPAAPAVGSRGFVCSDARWHAAAAAGLTTSWTGAVAGALGKRAPHGSPWLLAYSICVSVVSVVIMYLYANKVGIHTTSS